ncbi:MAG: 1-acyl-sn-glycerol-3-phosphate acyltransferase [Oleiphilaceae bacterium]|nr:1-acyl-sn-glycerol-3-phosphate acyltransferase [Oleiphilaceae bacterium]
MRLYRSFVRFLRFFNHLYFVEIRTSGAERMPESGPVIVAANHPSSILDAILLSTQFRRPIHYLARSGLFKRAFLASLFRQLGAIPVYRAHESEDARAQNERVFQKVYELFESGGCVGIFPEGHNSPQGQVSAIRPGAAKLALSAEARNDYRLGLVIVPVGLNAENRDLFMSSVLLRIGEPIRVADYADLNESDPQEAIRKLTADVQEALRRQALHVEDRQQAQLVEDLAEAFGYELSLSQQPELEAVEQRPVAEGRFRRWLWRMLDWYRPSANATAEGFEGRIHGRQYISDVVTRAARNDPQALAALRREVDRYKDHLSQTRLSEDLSHQLDAPVKERLIRSRMTLYALLMAPVALYGLVHNVVPYQLSQWLPRLSSDAAVRAFAYFGVGVLAFTISYALYGVWLWRGGMAWEWVLGYLATLPPAGFATLRYRRNIVAYRRKILVRTFFWNQEELIRLLRRERQAMFDHFRALAERQD